MLEHLTLLFGRALTGRIEITAIKAPGKDGHVSPRTRFFGVDQLEEAADYAATLNAEHMWNVYVGAATRIDDVFPGKAARDEDFHKAWAIHADIDDGHDLDTVRKAYRALHVIPPFIVVTGRTPTVRAQLWWPLDEPISDPDLYRRTLRGVAAALHTDPSVTAAKQLMRLAGGINWPKKEKRVLEATEIVQPGEAQQAFEIEQLHRAFPPLDAIEAHGVTGDVEVGHVGALGLQEVITDGREGYAFRLLRATLREWIGTTGCEPTADELYRAAAPVYLAKTDQKRPGRGPEFLKGKVAEALRSYHGGQIPGMRTLDEAVQTWAEKGAEVVHVEDPLDVDEFGAAKPDDGLFEVLSIDDIKQLPPASWLVKDMIPQDSLGFIFGAPGSFKSFVCYDLALSIAYDRPQWIGRDIRTNGSVLYIANEGSAGVQKRITAWQRKHEIEGDDGRFHLIRSAMSFMSTDDVQRLEKTVCAHVEKHGPVGIVFVDTVSRVLPGADENMQKDMTIFVSACDLLRERFGASVVGVHHTNKQGEMRGSTVFLGQGDFVFRVEKSDDSRGGVLTCEKQKDAEDGWKTAFDVERQEWVPDGHIEAVSSLTIAWTGAPDKQTTGAKWPGRDTLRAMQRDLAAAFMKGRPLSLVPQTKRDGRYAPTKLGQAFSIPAGVVQDVLETWMQNDVIEVQTADDHTKMKGLQVLKWID